MRVLLAALLLIPAPPIADLPALHPVISCHAVADVPLSGATVTTATVQGGNCEVRGTIAPANTFVVRLPVNGWTQRYVQTGCGGLCGTANINFPQAATCPPVRDGTVASATTDMGHQGGFDGSWAAGNPQAQIDFAYRGVHETSVVAKKLITAFYGHRPRFSYFTGCSDGGREALMEAQRYPDDFDGIAAGAPALNMAVQNTFHHAWNVLANKDAAGNYILLADKLPLIHSAVLAACDGLDGLVDGLLGDPRVCHFDPRTLICGTAPCLTPAEAAVVRKLHDGATDAAGRRLEPYIGHEWGSELEWTLFVPRTQGQVVGSEMFALSYLRYLAEPNRPRPDYQLTDLRFTVRSFWDTVLPSSTYLASMDPNLDAFRRSGGKLVLWHGWNDEHISPQGTLAYYDALRSPSSFVKLYLFPGMAHCGNGAGPNTFDILSPVMSWVEKGHAPGRIDATNGTITRPVYPYPAVARFDGTEFHPVVPWPPVRNDNRWVGSALFSHGYQTWPRAVDGRLEISRVPR